MSADAPLLELSGVEKHYAAASGTAGEVSILRNLNLTVRRGEAVAVVGPSGSGKTTLLNLLGSLDRPDRGRVRLDGEDPSVLDEAGLARLRNRSVGFVFQLHYLLPHLTVLENVLVPTLASDDPEVRRTAPERAERWLKRVGLGDRMGWRPGRLSGGERQRASVVRALINQPKLLLADEPTGALDRASARGLGELLRELNREEGLTLMVVTHSLELAREMGRVLELKDGALVEVASC